MTPELDTAAQEALENYSWPGNVRELQNCLERAVILAKAGRIELDHLPREVRMPGSHSDQRFVSTPIDRTDPGTPGEVSEEDATRRALESTEWNVAQAAKLLGISRTTIYRNMQKYRLKRPGQ